MFNEYNLLGKWQFIHRYSRYVYLPCNRIKYVTKYCENERAHCTSIYNNTHLYVYATNTYNHRTDKHINNR